MSDYEEPAQGAPVQRRRRARAGSDDEDAGPRHVLLTEEQKLQFGTDLARFFLFNEKSRLPASRTAIMQNVFIGEAKGARALDTTLPIAREFLGRAFGFEVAPIFSRGTRGRGGSAARTPVGRGRGAASGATDFVLLAPAPPQVPIPRAVCGGGGNDACGN
jgi:hypothetical protein